MVKQKTKHQRRDDAMLQAIALRLKDLRAKTGLTQLAVAEKTGQNIGRMEAAQSNMTISSVEKTCQFYDVSLEEFFAGVEYEK